MSILGNVGNEAWKNFFKTGKIDIAPDLTELNKLMLDLAKKEYESGAKKIVALTDISAEEKAKVLKEVDARYQALTTPESIRTFSLAGSAVLTNA